jgi:hypothetical protein
MDGAFLRVPESFPHHLQRKAYFDAIHAILTLQKKYGYAGWFRIKGYLERDYCLRFNAVRSVEDISIELLQEERTRIDISSS